VEAMHRRPAGNSDQYLIGQHSDAQLQMQLTLSRYASHSSCRSRKKRF
jgi:hypothetical protein